jgi:DNA-binding NtrC family response regulator
MWTASITRLSPRSRLTVWPGNVRELRNAIERAVVSRERGLISSRDLPEGIHDRPQCDDLFVVRIGSTLESVEQELIRRTLSDGQQSHSGCGHAWLSWRRLYDLLHNNGFQAKEAKPGRSVRGRRTC